jgi:hypothetical protein
MAICLPEDALMDANLSANVTTASLLILKTNTEESGILTSDVKLKLKTFVRDYNDSLALTF